MRPLSIHTLGRALTLATFVAVAACQSTSSPSAGALPSSTLPSPRSTAAAPRDIATPTATPDSVLPTVSIPPPPTTRSAPEVAAATVPAKPAGVTFKTDVVELPGPPGSDGTTYQATHTVRWKAPHTAGLEIRVYGVTECLAEPGNPSPGTSGPCLVEHTRLPASVMALAATAPAAAGEISWIAPFYYDCAGPPVGPDGADYHAIVIAAYNTAGHSIFAIADPGEWWRAAPDEVIC